MSDDLSAAESPNNRTEVLSEALSKLDTARTALKQKYKPTYVEFHEHDGTTEIELAFRGYESIQRACEESGAVAAELQTHAWVSDVTVYVNPTGYDRAAEEVDPRPTATLHATVDREGEA